MVFLSPYSMCDESAFHVVRTTFGYTCYCWVFNPLCVCGPIDFSNSLKGIHSSLGRRQGGRGSEKTVSIPQFPLQQCSHFGARLVSSVQRKGSIAGGRNQSAAHQKRPGWCDWDAVKRLVKESIVYVTSGLALLTIQLTGEGRRVVIIRAQCLFF